MKRGITLLVAVALVSSLFSTLFFSSVATSQDTYKGAVVDGLLVDRKNRWRGGVVGELLGVAFSGTVTEVSERAAREAAAEGKPVVYQTTDGFQRVEAMPVAHGAQTNCTKVRERVWQEGQSVNDEVKEICESEKT